MRLLIALPDETVARKVRAHAESLGWDAEITHSGAEALRLILCDGYDLALLHACLPEMDGTAILDSLAGRTPVCPPRILFLCDPAWTGNRRALADCTVPIFTAPAKLCALLQVLSQKPLPKLAAAQSGRVTRDVNAFLDLLSGMNGLKGRDYAAWMLARLIPSPLTESRPLGELYRACAQHFSTTPAAVERCLRVMVESVFTQGNLRFIERFFGATVDPERGKPTNRAFLLQAAQQLRTAHSLAETRSPNSSEMHHNPAAPTMV